MAIYAHDVDFEYAELIDDKVDYLDAIKALDNVTTAAQVFSLRNEKLPKPFGTLEDCLTN